MKKTEPEDRISRERDRIRALRSTKLLDTPPSEAFDQITRLAAHIFQAPIALVSLVDAERQWFKSRVGCDAEQMSREASVCSRAIEGRGVMVVEDLALDRRFGPLSLTRGGELLRFYAGAPLILGSGHALGTLCVIGHEPREFGPRERAQLETLAALAVSQIEMHRKVGRVNEVTRLPNRAQLAEDLEAARAAEPGARRALLLIDVMAHHRLQEAARAIGIEPLEDGMREVAAKLAAAAGPGWPVYHTSETRFCVKVRGESREERESFARDLIERLGEPFSSDGVDIQLEVHAGLVEFSLDEGGGVEALRRATSAMHEAGARGERLLWHDPELDAAHRRAFGLMRDIAAGLARGEFRLVFQPKFDAAGSCAGVEALARWRHPVHGDVSPAEFIPLIERTTLIHRFTPWAINAALAQHSQWRRLGIDLAVAVNVSSRNLDRPGFARDVAKICAARCVEPDRLSIECTENAAMTSEFTRSALLALLSDGIQASLDDFGMGYSNLACLRGLPVKMLKIDQSLVGPMDSDPAARELVRSLIALGHSLGFRMLAEGVETANCCALLIEDGCDALQGYLLAKPMEADAVPGFLAARSWIAAMQPAS